MPLGALSALVGCVEPAPATMSLVQAETYCAPYAQRYGRQSFPVREDGFIQMGLQAYFPDDFEVQDYYRRCVFAKAGERPSKRLDWKL